MYLVFDIGGTSIKHAVMADDGEIKERGKIKTPQGKKEAVDLLVNTLGGIYDEAKKTYDIEGIAIGLPGQIDIRKGIVYGGGALFYMHEVHLSKLLSERCDGVNVSLENDAKCAALAEVWLGNAKDCKDAVVMVFGTGVGGGVIRNKKVIHGKNLLAGEVSYILENMTMEELERMDKMPSMEHMDGYDVMEETRFMYGSSHSTINMCNRFAKVKGLERSEVTGEMIFEMAEKGDEDAVNILEDMYFSIAKQCINFYVALNPQIILIGGGISAEPKFIEGIQRYVDRIKRITRIYADIKIDRCKFLNDSNLLGALYNYKQLYE